MEGELSLSLLVVPVICRFSVIPHYNVLVEACIEVKSLFAVVSLEVDAKLASFSMRGCNYSYILRRHKPAQTAAEWYSLRDFS